MGSAFCARMTPIRIRQIDQIINLGRAQKARLERSVVSMGTDRNIIRVEAQYIEPLRILRIIGYYGGVDAAAHKKIAFNCHATRQTGLDQIIQYFIGDRLMEMAFIAVRP